MKRNLTTHQKIQFAKASNCIESEYALHCYYHSTEERPDSPYSSVLWSKRHDEISSAHGFGGLIGWDHCVIGWSNGMEIMSHKMYDMIKVQYPEVEDMVAKNAQDYYFIGGGTVMHAIASPVIEMAEDGENASATFYTPGILFADLSPSGFKRGGMMWERYGQNWVYEDDEWRVLHNQVMLDFNVGMATGNPGREQWEAMKNSGWIWNGMMPGPPLEKDRKGPANMDYWPVIPPQRTVMPPEPYKTYADGYEYIPLDGDGIGQYRVPDFPDNGIPEDDHP